MLQPLTVVIPIKVKFKWTVIEQKSSDKIKQIWACNNLSGYP